MLTPKHEPKSEHCDLYLYIAHNFQTWNRRFFNVSLGQIKYKCKHLVTRIISTSTKTGTTNEFAET